MADYRCQYGYGWCEVPYKDCPHWQGTFCELDVEAEKMVELKPCPFCGGDAFVYKRYDSIFRLDPTDFTVLCKDCRAGVRHYFQTESEAIEAWNRRTNE